MRHRPLGAYFWISLSAALVHFAAFLFFLLVTLSTPISKSLYLFKIDFKIQPNQPVTSIATELRFGVWGFCAANDLGLPSILSGSNGECTPIRLGYDLPQDLIDLTGQPALANDVLKALTFILVLHPVNTALAFVAMFTSLFLSSKAMTIISLILSVALALISGAVFAIDLAIEILAKNEIQNFLGPTVIVEYGNATWMVLIAMVLTWVSVVLLSMVACSCLGYRKQVDAEKY